MAPIGTSFRTRRQDLFLNDWRLSAPSGQPHAPTKLRFNDGDEIAVIGGKAEPPLGQVHAPNASSLSLEIRRDNEWEKGIPE